MIFLLDLVPRNNIAGVAGVDAHGWVVPGGRIRPRLAPSTALAPSVAAPGSALHGGGHARPTRGGSPSAAAELARCGECGLVRFYPKQGGWRGLERIERDFDL